MTTKEQDILNQLGYWDDDTRFLSLRFTPEQLEAFAAACERHHGLTPEEVVASICKADNQTTGG